MLLHGWIKMLDRSFCLSYIDAGTGSLIIQVLIGAVAGGLLVLKMSWKRLKNWVRRNNSAKGKLQEEKEHIIE